MRTYSFFFLFLLCISIVSADISVEDEDSLQNKIPEISAAVNKGDIDFILSQLSPQARAGLPEELESLRGKSIVLRQSTDSIEQLDNGQIKVKSTFSAQGPGWNINGLSNYYVFEKSNGEWSLVDTDFPEKLGPGYVFKFVGIIFLIILIISLPLTAFWIWMLIDAVKREFDNKVVWIVILALTSFIGALIYYFMVRRTLKQTEKNIKIERKT